MVLTCGLKRMPARLAPRRLLTMGLSPARA